jgi:hypothetical protein
MERAKGGTGVDRSSPEIETEMVDLTEVSFDELRTNPAEPLEPYLNRVITSIARPRMNLGGGGPPGRVD